MVYLLLPTFCALLGLSNAENEELMARIPEMMQALCPGANVCRENLTIDVPSPELKPGFVSCCTDCSCHNECHDTGNCCFHVQEKNVAKRLQTKESCLSLSMSPHEDEVIYSEKYKMITSVERFRSVGEKLLPEEQCGVKNVAPWGSFYPVFSKAKNRLYKNIECANLDDINDALYFDVCLICEQFDPFMSEVHNVIQNVWNSSNNDTKCYLELRYPGNKKDLNRHVCDSIDFCPTSFTILTEENLTFSKDEIVAACESGLWSPFVRAEIYANVFCYICNEEYLREDISCAKDDFNKDEMSHRNPHAFAVLINTDFISNINRKEPRTMTTPRVCMFDKTENCRPVYCPFGKSYDHLGQCDFHSKLWYNQHAYITLYLTTVLPIDEAIYHLIIYTLENKPSTLKSPWAKQWRILSIYSEHRKEHREHIKLYIVIRNKLRQISPKVLLQKVKKTINREWRLRIADKTFVFKSEFSPYYLRPEYFEEDDRFAVRVKKTFYSQYTLQYRQYELLTGNLQPITKLFLCNHVELAANEFILSTNKDVLFNLIKGDYLFMFEFLLVTSLSGMVAKVCIEDSGLREIVYQSAVSASVPLNYVIITVTLLLLIQKKFDFVTD